MKWRKGIDVPAHAGFYFCWHPTRGREVYGYRDGWTVPGGSIPAFWLDEDGMPAEKNDG